MNVQTILSRTICTNSCPNSIQCKMKWKQKIKNHNVVHFRFNRIIIFSGQIKLLSRDRSGHWSAKCKASEELRVNRVCESNMNFIRINSTFYAFSRLTSSIGFSIWSLLCSYRGLSSFRSRRRTFWYSPWAWRSRLAVQPLPHKLTNVNAWTIFRRTFHVEMGFFECACAHEITQNNNNHHIANTHQEKAKKDESNLPSHNKHAGLTLWQRHWAQPMLRWHQFSIENS